MVWVWLKFINRKFNNSVLIDCNFSKSEKTNLCTYLAAPQAVFTHDFLANGQFSPRCENQCTLFQLNLVKQHMFYLCQVTCENLGEILVRT